MHMHILPHEELMTADKLEAASSMSFYLLCHFTFYVTLFSSLSVENSGSS